MPTASRETIIELSGDCDHVVGFIESDLIGESEENKELISIIENPESTIFTLENANLTDLLKSSHSVSYLYNLAKVGKNPLPFNPETKQKLIKITVPKAAEFAALSEALNPISLNVEARPKGYIISADSFNLSELLKKDSYKTDQFAGMLDNIKAQCSELIVTRSFLHGSQTIIQDGHNPRAFIKRLKSGVFPEPELSADDIQAMAARMNACKWAVYAAAILSIIGGTGYVGFKLYELGKKVIDGQNQKFERQEELFEQVSDPHYRRDKLLQEKQNQLGK